MRETWDYLSRVDNARAIEVVWHRHKLGYLPRLDNAAAASLTNTTLR